MYFVLQGGCAHSRSRHRLRRRPPQAPGGLPFASLLIRRVLSFHLHFCVGGRAAFHMSKGHLNTQEDGGW